MDAFGLPELGYEYDALEPYIDAETMELHHKKHHRSYTDKFNAALEKHPDLFEKDAEEIIADLENVPEDIRMAVRNHGGGYVNHKLFWTVLAKDVPLQGSIKEAIERDFGSFEEFKKEFAAAAKGQFGSGWAWLAVKRDSGDHELGTGIVERGSENSAHAAGELVVLKTPNQDSPLTDGYVPLLAIDVWEHAYYLKYRNRRPEYIENFFNVINWEEVNRRYEEVVGT
ncbi:MAG: superoxide dismutase [Candidatus Woesearchaeota archaeon]